MYSQHHSAMDSKESKIQAALKLSHLKSRPPKVRHKRELVDLHGSAQEGFEKICHTMSGTQGWAKFGPGSVKLVKRHL